MRRFAKRLPQRNEDAPLSGAVAPATILTLPVRPQLVWECRSAHERMPFQADITEFSTSSPPHSLTPRPRLTDQLAPGFMAATRHKDKAAFIGLMASLRHLWRFLDVVADLTGHDTDDSSIITDAFGQSYKQHLLSLGIGPNSIRKYMNQTRSLVIDARKRAGVLRPELLWPTVRQDRGALHKNVDHSVLVPLYRVMKASLAADRREGARMTALAAAGSDPRADSTGQAWRRPENFAFAMSAFIAASATDPTLTREAFSLKIHKPQNFGLDRTIGFHKLFAPGHDETAAAFLIVTTHTGWNPETTAAIDITTPDRWCDERLSGAGDGKASVAIYAHKGRSDREQIAFSLKGPSSHPYQVILAQIARTQVLRDGLRSQLAAIDARPLTTNSSRDRVRLLEMLKSPWLYYKETTTRGVGGHVGVIRSSWRLNAALTAFGREAIDRAGPERSAQLDPLLTLTPGDIRDGFASFVYEDSLFNELRVKRVLGHRHLATTRHYLRQRRHIAQRFKEFTAFLEVMFDEAKQWSSVDPTILYLRVRFGDLTDEQRRRLSDHRNRTRMGMGCLDPCNPPPEISTAGRNGGTCTVQRCTLCRHGVVFSDSLRPLAVRMAELRRIRQTIAHGRFAESSFESEWLAIHSIVTNVFSSQTQDFQAIVAEHLERLQTGSAYLFQDAMDHALTDVR